MGILGAMWCVIFRHKVSVACQKELKKSGKYSTTCERCKYPLMLEIDTKDKNHFYYKENSQLKVNLPKIKL